MVSLLLHDDWEIYGDGTGDPQTLMFEPAKRILDICDRYGAKYTFYAEIGQQLHMLDAPEKKWKQYAATWESVLKDAVQRGHDVQLHFHPQWIGAELIDGEWKLDFSKWNTGFVEHELLDEWIGKGIDYIESLLQPVDPDYKVVSYRAGGWLCQPSTDLYTALRNNGIICDVSVMKGRYAEFEDGSYVDFRDAVSRYEPWEVHPDNFAHEKKGSGLWELPVYTETSALPHSAYLLMKAFRPLHYYCIHQKRKVQKGAGAYSPKTVIKAKEKEYYGSFGYMHYKHLLNYVDRVENYHQSKPSSMDAHLILLTHSKSFLDFENFEQFIRRSALGKNLQFSTTRAYVRQNL